MAKGDRSTELLVPGFVLSLNRTAEAAGFSTSIRSGKFGRAEPDSVSLISTWRGTPAELRRLDFLPMTEIRRAEFGNSISITWPCGRPILTASIRRLENNPETLEIDVLGGPVPKSITDHSKVQIIEYQDETAYYGSREALIASGVCKDKQIPAGKRSFRSKPWTSHDETPDWQTRRQMDGLYLHWIETEAAAKVRAEEWKRTGESCQVGDQRTERADYTSPEEWLERTEDAICAFAQVYLSAKFASVVTKSGLR